MIPAIGFMIAAYIITRMVALLGQPSPQANTAAKVMAVITIIVACICAADLLMTGATFPAR
jgi:hypothetical protein